VRAIESAKKPETRALRIEKPLAALRESEPAGPAPGPREDPSLEGDVGRALNRTMLLCPLARPPFVSDETLERRTTQ
jgi:hypothetical protein